MDIVRKVLGPRSKYNKTLPYTYIAKVPIIEGDDELFEYYFADTICGLVEHLIEKNILPQETQLIGVYQKKEVPLDIKCCTSQDGQWLRRPEICRSIETYYKETLEARYKGHKEIGSCDYDDREREGSGPY